MIYASTCVAMLFTKGRTLCLCCGDAIRWLRSRTGVNEVYCLSDRALQEFSNAILLHALSNGVYGLCAHTERHHGLGSKNTKAQ